jgi:hypothetical protein
MAVGSREDARPRIGLDPKGRDRMLFSFFLPIVNTLTFASFFVKKTGQHGIALGDYYI